MKRAIKQSTLTMLFSMISLLLLIIFAGLFYFTILSNEGVQKARDERDFLVSNANKFMEASSFLTAEARAYAATGDKAHYENYKNEIETDKNTEIAINNMRNAGLNIEEDELVEETYNLTVTLIPLEEKALKLTKDGKKTQARKILYGKEYNEWINTINENQKTLINMVEKRTTKVVDKRNYLIPYILKISFACLILSILIMIITAIIIRVKILNPIRRLNMEMQNITDGVFDSDIKLKPNTSEIGMLSNHVLDIKGIIEENKMINSDTQPENEQLSNQIALEIDSNNDSND